MLYLLNARLHMQKLAAHKVRYDLFGTHAWPHLQMLHDGGICIRKANQKVQFTDAARHRNLQKHSKP